MTSTVQATPRTLKKIPLLGHVIPLLWAPLETLQSLRSHGDVVAIYLGTRPVYVINSPELIQRMLVTEADKFTKGRFFDKGRPFVGNGLATSEGDFHMRQRRLMLPIFHRERLRVYAEVMREQSAAIADAWTPGQRIAADQAMHELTFTVTTKALFHSDLGDRAVAEIQHWLPIFLKGLMRRSLSPIDMLEKLPIPSNRQFELARSGLKKIIDDVIEIYLADPADHGDLLSMLVNVRDEDTGEGMSHEQLHDELMTILIAGTETTGTALSWLFHELGHRSDITARLYPEIDSVLGGRPVTFDDVPALTYTRRIVNETLRLHSPVWMSMRRAATSVELGGVHIPPGSELLYSPTTMHRDPAFYTEPDRFDPDRWESSPRRGTYLPFGGGRHKCIGDHFALTEMVVAVATIAAKWQLIPAPGHTVREQPSSTLRPDRLPMTVVPRGSR
jgi:cytochrome P450